MSEQKPCLPGYAHSWKAVNGSPFRCIHCNNEIVPANAPGAAEACGFFGALKQAEHGRNIATMERIQEHKRERREFCVHGYRGDNCADHPPVPQPEPKAPAPEPQVTICGECGDKWPCEVATGEVSGDALVLRHHPCSGPPVSITAPEPQDEEPIDIQALHIAAQCWCDPETRSTVMDPILAQAFAKRLVPLLALKAENSALRAGLKHEAYLKYLEEFDASARQGLKNALEAAWAENAALKATIQSLNADYDEVCAERDAAELKFRLYSEHDCPNQPLLDDLERFRKVAENGAKSEKALSRMAAKLAEEKAVTRDLAALIEGLKSDRTERAAKLAEVEAVLDCPYNKEQPHERAMNCHFFCEKALWPAHEVGRAIIARRKENDRG